MQIRDIDGLFQKTKTTSETKTKVYSENLWQYQEYDDQEKWYMQLINWEL